MSLLKKLLGGTAPPPPPPASRFQDSQADRASPRRVALRDVVHVVWRDTLRRHGIPLDWMECRTLSMVQSNASMGTYVTLVVKQGQERLLPHVPALQASFRQTLERFDPEAAEWVRGLGWQFEGPASAEGLPDPASWREPTAAPAPEDEDLQADLRALFAIRDAAMGEKKKAQP